MALEPGAGEACDFGERTRLLEKMAGPRHDLNLFFAAQQGQRLLVEPDDGFVQSADDKQRWRLDSPQRRARQVRAASERDDSADVDAQLSRRHECRARS